MDVRVGLWRKLSAEELMLLNCGVGEDSWESFWTARRSSQSILKEISPGCSLEGLMLKLKLQYFGHLMWRVDSLEKTLMLQGLGAGGERDNRRWGGWMASRTRCTWVWVNSGSWWWTGRPGVLQFMGSQRVGHDWATKLNWKRISFVFFFQFIYWLETVKKLFIFIHKNSIAITLKWMAVIETSLTHKLFSLVECETCLWFKLFCEANCFSWQ